MFKKNRVMGILLTQSVTLFFLYFYYPHEIEIGYTYNTEYLYIMSYMHREKKFKIEKNTKY